MIQTPNLRSKCHLVPPQGKKAPQETTWIGTMTRESYNPSLLLVVFISTALDRLTEDMGLRR